MNNVNSEAVKKYMNIDENSNKTTSSTTQTLDTNTMTEHEKRVKEILGN